MDYGVWKGKREEATEAKKHGRAGGVDHKKQNNSDSAYKCLC